MHFDIRHTTVYRYSAPVRLGPHIVRLLPRCAGDQRLLDYRCTVDPPPTRQSEQLDAAGNRVTRLWFGDSTSELRIDSASLVETRRQDPVARLLEACAQHLPVAYPADEADLLAAYGTRATGAPAVVALGETLAAAADHATLGFLDALNRHLYTGFARVIRAEGPPQPPEQTLALRQGACRDLALLFMAVCQSRGLAARFVSGYQAHAASGSTERYLHAWPEVYLPGSGWCGYDPTHGSAVADGHVALAAAGSPGATLPIAGSFYGDGVRSTLDFRLRIRTAD
ncbi:MAG: transglutaminase family protein [Pseudomonadota bacterium]